MYLAPSLPPSLRKDDARSRFEWRVHSAPDDLHITSKDPPPLLGAPIATRDHEARALWPWSAPSARNLTRESPWSCSDGYQLTPPPPPPTKRWMPHDGARASQLPATCPSTQTRGHLVCPNGQTRPRPRSRAGEMYPPLSLATLPAESTVPRQERTQPSRQGGRSL